MSAKELDECGAALLRIGAPERRAALDSSIEKVLADIDAAAFFTVGNGGIVNHLH
jgi:hypothetical protein